jgi:tetratricopeptide (TPR) repeat protein
LAEAYAQFGDDTNAREALSKATNIAATDNIVLVRTGEHNLDEGKYEAAKGYFDQALINEAGHPGALIGRVYANIGKKLESLDAAEKDIEKLTVTPQEYLTPRWKAGVSWAKGLVDLRRGRAMDATKSFDEALKLDPQNLRNFALRAKVYASGAQWNEAVKDYQAVLAKRPNHRPSQVGLALAYSTLGKSVESGQIVEQLLAKDPNDAELQLVKGRSLKTQGKYDDAIAAYQKVLALQKTNFDAKLEIGQALRLKKDFAKAIEHIEGLQREVKNRNLTITTTELGRVYLDQGQSDKAKDILFDAVKKDQEYADLFFFLGKATKAKAAQKEAINEYLRLAPAGQYAAEAQKLLKK